MKFVSLCLAVLIWFLVGGEERIDKNVQIPIEVINLPRDLVISNQFKKEVEVTVNGPRSLILEITKMAISRSVDLSNYKPGTHVVDIAVDSIKMPRGVSVQRIQPSSIILSLDKLVSKDLHIEAVTSGKVASGYQLKDISIDPAKITITGPQSQLSKVEILRTEKINIAGIKESASLQVPLDLEPAIVELIGETSVTAEVDVETIKVEKTFKNIPVEYEVDGVKIKTEPSTVNILVKVPKLFLEEKKNPRELFVVTVLGVGKDRRQKVVVIPNADDVESLEILAIEPQFVQVENPPNEEIQVLPGRE